MRLRTCFFFLALVQFCCVSYSQEADETLAEIQARIRREAVLWRGSRFTVFFQQRTSQPDATRSIKRQAILVGDPAGDAMLWLTQDGTPYVWIDQEGAILVDPSSPTHLVSFPGLRAVLYCGDDRSTHWSFAFGTGTTPTSNIIDFRQHYSKFDPDGKYLWFDQSQRIASLKARNGSIEYFVRSVTRGKDTFISRCRVREAGGAGLDLAVMSESIQYLPNQIDRSSLPSETPRLDPKIDNRWAKLLKPQVDSNGNIRPEYRSGGDRLIKLLSSKKQLDWPDDSEISDVRSTVAKSLLEATTYRSHDIWPLHPELVPTANWAFVRRHINREKSGLWLHMQYGARYIEFCDKMIEIVTDPSSTDVQRSEALRAISEVGFSPAVRRHWQKLKAWFESTPRDRWYLQHALAILLSQEEEDSVRHLNTVLRSSEKLSLWERSLLMEALCVARAIEGRDNTSSETLEDVLTSKGEGLYNRLMFEGGGTAFTATLEELRESKDEGSYDRLICAAARSPSGQHLLLDCLDAKQIEASKFLRFVYPCVAESGPLLEEYQIRVARIVMSPTTDFETRQLATRIASQWRDWAMDTIGYRLLDLGIRNKDPETIRCLNDCWWLQSLDMERKSFERIFPVLIAHISDNTELAEASVEVLYLFTPYRSLEGLREEVNTLLDVLYRSPIVRASRKASTLLMFIHDHSHSDDMIAKHLRSELASADRDKDIKWFSFRIVQIAAYCEVSLPRDLPQDAKGKPLNFDQGHAWWKKNRQRMVSLATKWVDNRLRDVGSNSSD